MKQEVDLQGRRLLELPPKVPRLFGRSCPQSTRLGTGYFIQHAESILLVGTEYSMNFYCAFLSTVSKLGMPRLILGRVRTQQITT